MQKDINYFYKGYDITSNDRMEKYTMEFSNPYGYNFESNSKRVVDEYKKVSRTNQNYIKNKEYFGKKR